MQKFIVSVVAAVVCISAFASPAMAGDDNAAILKELQAIRKELSGIAKAQSALREEIKALKEELAEKEDEKKANVLTAWNDNNFQENKGNLKVLSKIELPKDPTDEQIREYIRAIIEATKGQNSFSDTDIQVRLYMKVGPDKLKLLVDAIEMSAQHGPGQYHLMQAIKKMARAEHKSLILQRLAVNYELASIITTYGWTKDAADTLKSVMRTNPRYLPTEWLRAVAALDDPEKITLLQNYMISGCNPRETYKLLCAIPGADLEGTVKKTWERKRASTNDFEKTSVACIALKHGHLDALANIAIELSFGNRQHREWIMQQATAAVIRHTTYRGNMKKLKSWFDANRHRLVFDKENFMFRIDETKPAAKGAEGKAKKPQPDDEEEEAAEVF